MTPTPTQAEIEALAERYEEDSRIHHRMGPAYVTMADRWALIARALRRLAATDGAEAVAWRWRIKGPSTTDIWSKWHVSDDYPNPYKNTPLHEVDIEPLYAAPPPPEVKAEARVVESRLLSIDTVPEGVPVAIKSASGVWYIGRAAVPMVRNG